MIQLTRTAIALAIAMLVPLAAAAELRRVEIKTLGMD
jgi:hypothetical protein